MIDLTKLQAAKAEILRRRFDRAGKLVLASRAVGVRLDLSGIEEALRLAKEGRLEEVPDKTEARATSCRTCRGL